MRPEDRIQAVYRDRNGQGTQHVEYLSPSRQGGTSTKPLLRFDLSAIPRTAAVFEAQLQLRQVDVLRKGRERVGVSPVVNWRARRLGSEISWVWSCVAGTKVEWDVTEPVTGSVDGSIENRGVAITNQAAGVVFSSPELKVAWAP